MSLALIGADNNRLAKLVLFGGTDKKIKSFFKKKRKIFGDTKKRRTFASQFTIAQMAESVDALVSNTSGATHPGSIPGLGTKERLERVSLFFIYKNSCSESVNFYLSTYYSAKEESTHFFGYVVANESYEPQ